MLRSSTHLLRASREINDRAYHQRRDNDRISTIVENNTIEALLFAELIEIEITISAKVLYHADKYRLSVTLYICVIDGGCFLAHI